MVIYDAGTSAFRRELLSDYAAGIAGDGLGASAGALSVTVDDTGIEINSDTLRLKDSGVATAKIADNAVTLAKLAGLARGKIIYGDASGDPAALAVGSANTILSSDGTDISYTSVATDMIADNAVTLAKMAGITRGSIILGDSSGDPSLLAKGSAAQFLQSDGTDPSYVSISGDATVAAGGALTIANDAVESGMLNDNVISGQSELAQGSLAAADEFLISDGGTIKRFGVDSLAKDALALTTEAAMDLADDYIVFLDGGATGETKKEQWADLVSSLAGNGLTATNGVLSADAAGTPTAAVNGTRLSEGFNYLTGTLAGAMTVSLPEAGSGPTVGDVYYLKTGAGVDGTRTVTLACSGAHSIDGVSSIVLESPYAAVSLVYMASGSWSLF